jgi:thioredoxin-like negative regulator of GroEL
MEGVPRDGRRDDRPLLLFFSNRRSGPARRMSSLVAWFRVTQKKRLRVVEVDADDHAELVNALDVTVVPTLVLLRGGRVLDRCEGRVTGNEITRMLERHVVPDGKAGRAA